MKKLSTSYLQVINILNTIDFHKGTYMGCILDVYWIYKGTYMDS